MNFPILSSLILLPTIGALFLFFTKNKEGNNLTAKYVALFTSVVNFLISIYLWISFDQSISSFQFIEDRIWIKGFINYKVGVDGISILFIKSSKKLGLFLWKFCDGTIIDGFGPDGISSFIKKCSIKATKFQSGYIYQYAFVMLLGFSALLTFLIVK